MSEREAVERRALAAEWRGDQAWLDWIVSFALSERARVWEEAASETHTRAVAAHRAGADAVVRFGVGSQTATIQHATGDAIEDFGNWLRARAAAEKEGGRGEG